MPVRRYKLYAYMLSAGFTAVAGALYALMVGFIDPDSGFGILISVEMVIMAALGGAGPGSGASLLLRLDLEVVDDVLDARRLPRELLGSRLLLR